MNEQATDLAKASNPSWVENLLWADNAGVRLRYADTGDSADAGASDTGSTNAEDSGTDASGQAPLIFVPGMTDVIEDYFEILPMFGRRTVVMELRGHGESDAPETGYRYEDQIGDVGAVIDAVTDGPVHLVSFSRGTTYMLGWALANPDRVLSISTGDYPLEEIALPMEIVDKFGAGRWRRTPVSDRIKSHATHGIFAAATNRSLWEEVIALNVPILAVRGGGTSPLSDAGWERYETDVPEAELHYFTDSTHDVFRPDPERYPHLVKAHMAKAEAAARG